MQILTTLICFFCLAQSVSSQSIASTHLLRLSEYNLAKIGIRISDNGITFTENANSENLLKHNRKILLSKNSISVNISKRKDQNFSKDISPMFVVNTFKNGSASYYRTIKNTKIFTLPDTLNSDNSSQLKNADWANKLVCVVVEFTPRGKIQSKNIAYLWYEPSTDFIDALPDDIAEPIWSEIIMAEHGIVTSPDGNFTESWRSTSQLLTHIVYPNPVHDSKATLEFTLSSPTILSIVLYDISGNRIRDFYTSATYQAGKQTIELPLNEIVDGMYLIAIIPELRKPIIQRLLITR